jgi:hypothetical protein
LAELALAIAAVNPVPPPKQNPEDALDKNHINQRLWIDPACWTIQVLV